jgi:hypothetical protein
MMGYYIHIIPDNSPFVPHSPSMNDFRPAIRGSPMPFEAFGFWPESNLFEKNMSIIIPAKIYLQICHHQHLFF